MQAPWPNFLKLLEETLFIVSHVILRFISKAMRYVQWVGQWGLAGGDT